MKTAVVTGASGFVGSAIVRELKAQEIRVVSIVHSKENVPADLNGTYLIECSLDSYSSIVDELKQYNPEVFYHLAWSGSAGKLRGDERVQLANIQGTCDAVRLASSVGCSKFVFASSIMEYEVEAEIKSLLSPGINSIYSTAKLTADYMARIVASSQNIGYISALISNIYGPGEKSPRLINSSIRTLLRKEHLSLSPGKQLYDFIYIDDAARMFFAIGSKGIPGRIYYIGNEKPRPLREFLEELRDIVAPGTELGLGDLPFNGVSLSYREFDTRLLYDDTEVVPKVTFAQGIKLTRDWILEEDIYE